MSRVRELCVEFVRNSYDHDTYPGLYPGTFKTENLQIELQADYSNCGVVKIHNLYYNTGDRERANKEFWELLQLCATEGLPVYNKYDGGQDLYRKYMAVATAPKLNNLSRFCKWLKDKHPDRVDVGRQVLNRNSDNYIRTYTIFLQPRDRSTNRLRLF